MDTNNETVIVNGIEVNMTSINKLMQQIIIKESRNIKTKEYTSTEMINKIKTLIEREI